MKKASIIILNWNGKGLIKDCLNSVYNQTYKNFEVYFIDNGSTDNSIAHVKKNFPKSNIFQLDKNKGFAKGMNEGIKKSLKDNKTKYIVCLNNDTIVDKNWLKELIKTADRGKKIGMVSSKAYFKTGEIQNAGLSLEGPLQLNKPGGISIGFGKKDKEVNLNSDKEIFVPGGVAPLYKREMLEEIYRRDKEFFDERYFAYAEDLDLGFRGRLLGWKSYLSVNAKLIHLHSITGGSASKFKAYYSERNTLLTAFKNFSSWKFAKFLFSNVKLKIEYAKKGNNSSIKKLRGNIGFAGLIEVLIKAHFSFIFLIPRMLIKRIKIQLSKKVSNEEIEYWFKNFNRENVEK
ncbi:glycosyltransferase family 2 protein [Candidatus Woesearchaeota archaeon]|nr:glycosyltransferase family 2 protein [Candidatus Woesearchaeota archaeon]